MLGMKRIVLSLMLALAASLASAAFPLDLSLDVLNRDTV
jgi:hypothetical protein